MSLFVRHSPDSKASSLGNGDDPILRRQLVPLSKSLEQLLAARHYAKDAQHDIWDFAVEARTLLRAGLTVTELRWLVCKGYAEHAREVIEFGETSRTFRHNGMLHFTKRSCFVLTDLGAEFAHKLLNGTAEPVGVSPSVQPESPSTQPDAPFNGASRTQGRSITETPVWDCDYREVRYSGQVVKQFKLPSPNQEAILMAFQEEGWPPRIDDPLSPHAECDAKQRLHDTIRSLNRNQKSRLIRFRGDGTGQGILWEPIAPGSEDESA